MTTDTIKESLPSAEDLLGALGLQFQRATTTSVTGTLATFGLGAVMGATLALLFAPRAGHEMRQDLGERLGALKEKVGERMEDRHDGEAEQTAR